MEIYEHNRLHIEPPLPPQRKRISPWTAVAFGLACTALVLSLFALIFAFAGKKDTDRVPQNDYAAAYAAVRACVVEVYAPDNNNAAGSGVVYKTDDEKAYVLTNLHVVGTEGNVQVRIGEFGEKIAGRLLGYDAYHDIAMVEVATENAGAHAVVRGADPVVGTKVLAVGNSLGYGMAAFDGIVSKTDRMLKVSANAYSQEKRVPVYAVTSPVNAGMSGGGLFSLDGKWLGINTYQTYSVNGYDGERPVDGMSYSVPAAIVDKIAQQILHEQSGGQIKKLDVTSDIYIEDRIDFHSLYFKAQYTTAGFTVCGTTYDAANPPYQMRGELPKEGDIVLSVGSLAVTVDTGYVPLYAACWSYVNDDALASAQTLQITFLRGDKEITTTYANVFLKNY